MKIVASCKYTQTGALTGDIRLWTRVRAMPWIGKEALGNHGSQGVTTAEHGSAKESRASVGSLEFWRASRRRSCFGANAVRRQLRARTRVPKSQRPAERSFGIWRRPVSGRRSSQRGVSRTPRGVGVFGHEWLLDAVRHASRGIERARVARMSSFGASCGEQEFSRYSVGLPADGD